MNSRYQTTLNHGGCMISAGQGLGLMVGTNPLSCPKGWVFLHINSCRELGETVFNSALEAAQRGRMDWPDNDKTGMGPK